MKTTHKEIEERLLELTSLFELSKTLSSTLNLQAVLNNILLTPMGRMMINKGVVFLASPEYPGEYVIEALKGLPRNLLNTKFSIEDLPADKYFFLHDNKLTDKRLEGSSGWADFAKTHNLKIGFPIQSGSKTLGMLVFGEKLSGMDFADKDVEFLVSLSNLSAAAIENSIMIRELQEVNRKLDRSNQELNTLFELGSELSATFNVDKIIRLLGYALMGQLLVNKYAVFVLKDGRIILRGSQGYKDIQKCVDDSKGIRDFLGGLQTPFLIENSDSSSTAQTLRNNNIKLVIPMKYQEETRGIVCLGDKINRNRYSDEEIEFLITLGNQAIISLENAMLVDEMLEKQRIEEELSLAREIQENLLPREYPRVHGILIAAVNVPSRFVGGDYYDIVEFDDATQGIVIADVSGKGVPASLLMANLQASFRALAEVVVNPANLVEKINNIIHGNTSSDKFITLFYGRLHREMLKLEYCNAGHNHPFVISEDGQIRFLEKGGLILGILPNSEYQMGTITLQHGDTLVMYTDGITEALNGNSEEFGEERLIDMCKKNHHLSAQDLKNTIVEAVRGFSGGVPQYDDITLVILKVESNGDN